MHELLQNRKFVSAAELGRILNVPATRLTKLIADGAITPDEVVSERLKLFSVDRIPAIQTQIEHRQEVSQ